MEPLSALSVAGTVISLVDTSLTFLKMQAIFIAQLQEIAILSLGSASCQVTFGNDQAAGKSAHQIPYEEMFPVRGLASLYHWRDKETEVDIDFGIKDLTVTAAGKSWTRRAAKTANVTLKGVLSREKIDDLSKQLSMIGSQLMLAMFL